MPTYGGYKAIYLLPEHSSHSQLTKHEGSETSLKKKKKKPL